MSGSITSHRPPASPQPIRGMCTDAPSSFAFSLRVANAGSVGLPFDGDPRASYLLVEDHRAEVIRVEYAVELEVAALHASGYPDADRIAEMLRTGRFVPVRAA